MSIINEALKKAGISKELGGAAPVQHDSVRRNLEIEFQRRKQSVNWGPLFILLVLVLITGPIIAPIFSSSFKQANVSTQPALQSTNQIPAGAVSPIAALPDKLTGHEN